MRALILVIMMRKTYCWAGTRRLCNLFSSVSFPGFFCLVLLTGEAELPGGYKELKCSTAGPTVYVVLWDTLKSAVVSHKRSTLWPMPLLKATEKSVPPKKWSTSWGYMSQCLTSYLEGSCQQTWNMHSGCQIWTQFKKVKVEPFASRQDTHCCSLYHPTDPPWRVDAVICIFGPYPKLLESAFTG